MSLNSSGVIVIGGHVQGLGIIRIFGQNNIPVILIDETSLNIARFSKYCSRFILYKKKELLSFLLNGNQCKEYTGWLIIPTNDYHVKVLSQNHNELSEVYKVSTDNWERISLCYNKINTYKLANELNITIPKTYFPENMEDLTSINIQFPCIIKPAIMHEFYEKLKKKVFVCNDREELILFYNKASSIIPSDQIIVQEIIKGSSENQFSACFLFQNGKIISSLTACRKRQHPIDFGNATTFAEIIEQPELFNIGEKILKHIGYNGICEVEFKRNSNDGKYYLLEINPRTWKWHLISQKTGKHFLINLYNSFYNLPIIKDSRTDLSVCWKHTITDFPTVIRQILKKQYKKSTCNNIQYAVWDQEDILPSIFEVLLLPYLIFKR